MRRLATPLTFSVALLLGLSIPARAQENLRREIQESQLRLQRIREERAGLQREMERLRSQVRDIAGELANVERQRDATARLLQQLDFQAEALSSTVATITEQLALTRERLYRRQTALRQRLRAIYKRGPLHAVRVLLGAESFGDLLTRYKYLHLAALYDRLLVGDIQHLERELAAKERELAASLAQIEGLKNEKLEELARLESLEAEHQKTLRLYRERQDRTQGRLAQLARDEERLTDVIAELERKRAEAERARTASAAAPRRPASLTTRDLGSLPWPVEGRLVYRFGPERRPNGVVLRWNGIGIGAPVGTPVRAVEAGTVVMARPFEGYGPTVMVSHGGGYYTLYLYLQDIAVSEGEEIAAGQVVGTVGGEKTPEGPHLEFQVRAPLRGIPEPVDPLDWLRGKAES